MTRPIAGGHSSYVASAPATQQLDPDARACDQFAIEPTALMLDAKLRDLYVAYAPLVWRTLRRLGVPETLLEDGVQDVFLIVHRQQGKFEGRSTIKTWVVGIAVRVAKGYRRAEGRRIHRVEHLAAWFASDADAADSPSDAAERREASDVMHALLANLPDELREVLVLVELEELTIREACDAIGIRLRTGQRRLRAAVEALSSAVADFLAADWRSHP